MQNFCEQIPAASCYIGYMYFRDSRYWLGQDAIVAKTFKSPKHMGAIRYKKNTFDTTLLKNHSGNHCILTRVPRLLLQEDSMPRNAQGAGETYHGGRFANYTGGRDPR
jgi:hypothetical protein